MRFNMWTEHTSDVLTHEGNVRIFIDLRDKVTEDAWDDGYRIIAMQVFTFGLTTNSNNCKRWIEETIHEDSYNGHLYWKLKEELKLENGFYEIVGEFYYHGWTSGYYEPEYEFVWDLREVKHNKMTYDQMYEIALAEHGDELNDYLDNMFGGIEFGRYDGEMLFFYEPDETLYAKIIDRYGVSNTLDRNYESRKKPNVKKMKVKDMIKWVDKLMTKPQRQYPNEFNELKEFLAERALLVG